MQAARAARLPIVAGHVALMPDAHVGIGATVGSVIPTEGAIIPAAVGVDIGCGMVATETTLTAADLPDTLEALMRLVERRIPAGVGKGHDDPSVDRALGELGRPHTDADRASRRRRSPGSSARSARATTSSRSASTSGTGSGWCCTRARAASATSSRPGTSRTPRS